MARLMLTPEEIALDEEQEQMPHVAELDREIARARDPKVLGILEKERADLDQRLLKFATPAELKSAGTRNVFDQFDAPGAQKNVFDQFDEPLPTRGAASEVFTGAKRSVFGQLPQQIGQALKWLGAEPKPIEQGGLGSTLYEIGQSLENVGSEYLDKRSNQLNPDVHNWFTNALASGAEMLAPSAAPLAVAAFLPETIPAWVALGLGAGSMSWLYGGSQAQQTYERGIKANLSPEAARRAGIETGAIEAGGEILGTMALGWLFGFAGKSISKIAGMDPVEGVFAAVKNPAYFKDFAKKLPAVYGTEIGTEIAQNWSEAAVEEAHGIPQEVSPLEQGKQAIAPTFGMTTLLLPFGLAGHALQARQNTIAGAALEDANTPATIRSAAADAVGSALASEDKNFAAAWRAKAADAIANGQPIELGRGFVEPVDPVQKILGAATAGEAIAAALETVKTPGLIHAQIAAETDVAHAQRATLEQTAREAQYAAAEAQRAASHMNLPDVPFELPPADAAELATRLQTIAAQALTPAQQQAQGVETPIAEQLRSARRIGESQSDYEARLRGEVPGDRQERQGISGQVGGRQELVQAGLEQGTGGEAAGAGRVVQGAPEGDRGAAGGEGAVVPRGTAAAQQASAARIFGKTVGDLTDAELRFAATSHRMSAHREVAQAEIARRQPATEAQAAPAETAPASRTYTPEEGAKAVGSDIGLEVALATKEETPTFARMAATVVEKAFGKKVVFVKAGQAGYDAKGKARWGTDGAVLPDDPSTVYVNVNSNRRWQALIGHETTHALKRTNAAVYNELQDAVNSALTDDAFTWAEKTYGERTKDIQNEEIVANVVGDQMHEPRFWLEVFGRTGNVKALANAMFSTLDKIRNKITGQSRLDYNTREFITDTKRVRSAVAKAYASWQKGAGAEARQKVAALQSKPSLKFKPALRFSDNKSIPKKLRGKVIVAEPGETIHPQIYNRLGLQIKDDDTDMGFVDGSGRYYTRDEATEALGREAAGETLGRRRLESKPAQKIAVAGGAAIHSRALESKPPGKYDFQPEIVKAVEAFAKKTPVANAKGAADLVNTLAAEHRAKLLSWMDEMGANERPVITLHEGDEARGIPTVYLLGWSYKEATEIHDHGNSRAGVRIMRGDIAERVFSISREALAKYDAKQPTGIDATVHQRVLHAGRTLTIPDPYIHEFVGVSESTKDRDVSLHAYFPPLLEMNYFTYDDGKLKHNGMWAEGKQAALESKPIDFSKFVGKLPRTEAGEIAGSRGMGTREVWNLVQRMERLAREGKPYKGWYRDSAQEILKAFKGDRRSAEIFTQLIAITSANREVKANFTLAEKALVQYAEGQPIEVGSQQTNDKINDLLYFGIPWDGRKTNNFYRDIMQEIGGPKSRETTQDMHMGQMALGKKQLNNSEYSFLDKVTKFVAERFGVKPSEAQAMVWVPQKARSLVRRYLEKGFHRGMSAGGMKRMALAEAAINYGSIARKRWSMLGPEVGGFPKAREIRAAGQQVTAEVKPSTKMAIGQALVKLSMSRLQEYQQTAFNRVFGGDPGILMRAFGLNRTQYRVVEGGGGYDGTLAPNAIITLNIDAATAEKIAKAWMYIFRQDSVPFFRADDKLLDDPKASAAVKIRFAESFSNTKLREIYDNLRSQVEPGIGLTKLDHNVIAIVNYRDETGKPFLMSDEDFYNKLGAAVQANDLGAKINGYGRFGAETAYPYHDWEENPDGQGLLSAASEGRPDLQARLGRWANIFGKFAEGRAREAQRAAGVKPGAEAGRAAEAVALQSKPTTLPQFERWSAGTKVVDAEGDPQVVYHGTSKDVDFKAFKVNERGAWFTSDPEVASDYASDNDSMNRISSLLGKKNRAARVMPVFLQIKNPYTPNKQDSGRLKYATNYAGAQREIVRKAKAEGYDGIDMGGGTWVAFKPEQIKSVFNSGAYSEHSGNILQSRPQERDYAFTGRRGTSPRITWAERPSRGTWVSETADGRYSIEPEADGYWAMVNGEALRWETSRQAAIATINDQFLEDIAEGTVANPVAEKTITRKYKPEQTERVVSGLKTLAKVPGVFRLATSDSKKLIEVLREVDTEKVVSNVTPMGGDPAGAGGIAYAITFKNGKLAFVIEDDVDKTAHVDAAMFDKGSQMGSFLYPAVLNWAKNNKLKLVVDPNGLTLTNTFRRTEQMLSGALKLGTTRAMSPFRYDGVNEQGLWGWNEEPETTDDENKNLAILALTAMENTLDKVPEAKDYRYDFDTNKFVDGDGEEIGAKRLDALVAEPDARQFSIGRVTLARAILINSLVKEEGKPTVDGLSKLVAEPKEERTLALYSKPKERAGRAHDYEPGWDYQADENVPKTLKAHVDKYTRTLIDELLPQLNLFKGFEVHFAASGELGKRTLGKYVDGTGSWPVIMLDRSAIQSAAAKYGADELTGVETTILHELAHAIEEVSGLEVSERDAEKFAETYYKTGKIAERFKKTILESKPPSYVGTNPVALTAARKAGLYREEKPFLQRVKEMMPTFATRFTQGLTDQFAPIKELDFRSYMLARMSKATDGAVEAMFLYGKPFLDNGALNVNLKDSGLTKVLQRLQGEHDRFIAWIAGNRAAQLKTEGRERLFDDDEIDWLKDLNKGQMKDGKNRAVLYAEVHKEFNAYGKAVLDVAEQQGLIDPESRAVWEKDFYVPFYRNLEAEVSGPTVKSGLVSQQAFKRLKGGKEELNDLLANTLQNWSHLLSASMKNRAALSTMEAAVKAGAAIEVPSEYAGKQMQIGKILKALDGGTERYFVLEDPLLIDAISSMEAMSFGAVTRLFGNVKRWLTVGVTANPAFKIRNLLRDSISSIGVSELPYNPISNVARAWADTAHGAQLRASTLASGGIIRFGTQLEGSRAEYIRDLINEGVEPDSILDKENKVVSMLKLAWDHYQEFGDRGENVNRIALYKQLRAEGKDHLEASYAARDLLDFSKQGTWRAIRFLVQTVPFFNARLQGLAKLGQGFKENPARMGYVLGAIGLASMALMLAYKDDDDWKKRADFDRNNFWFFKVGDKAFRIPKPFEVGAIGTFMERLLELGVSDEMTGKRFGQQMLALISDQLSMNPTPQLVKPMIELYANKDFFRGQPIETMGMEKLSPSERISRTTSATAQLLGKADILSPVALDHLARSYFGWFGTAAMTLLDFGIRPAMGLPNRPATQLRDAFLVGNFVESLPTNSSRYVTDFYNSSKVIEQSYADWRHALTTGQPEKAREIREAGKEDIALHGAVMATNKQLAALNKLEKMVENDNTMSAAEKRTRLDRLDALKNQSAKRYSDLVLQRAESRQ